MSTARDAGGFSFTKEYVGTSARMCGVSTYQVWSGTDFLGYVSRTVGEKPWKYDDGRKYGEFLYSSDAWEGEYPSRLAAAVGLKESHDRGWPAP